ncbi:THO complex subunit 7 homolog [Centruroides vittatus]|uniref:THO complex subunit 7 homolog n=1 Tax=Centruroides vittatus TaxID=120091 RepID=UPI00351012A2
MQRKKSGKMASVQLSDDEISRRKLLMDGDGMGDDRRLNMLIKMFVKWCLTKEETEDERILAYERLKMTLAQCEFSMTKSQTVMAMNYSEMQNYEELYHKIEKGIAEAQQKIIDSKSELQQAKRIRKNKQEYDALAKVIEVQPDRKGTMGKLEQLNQDIRALQKMKDDVDTKLEKRRKQFQVLLSAVYEMQQLIKEDEPGDSQAMDTS